MLAAPLVIRTSASAPCQPQSEPRNPLGRPEATLVSRRPDAGPAEPTLLWIDDEISREDSGVRLLEFEGYKVDCAVTGAAGLAMARAGEYRGILLDLRLPDIPGLAVLTALRAEAIRAPVLVLTGFGDTESAFGAGHCGASAFERKPLFGDDLLAAVKRLLEGVMAVVGHDVEDVLPANVRAQYSSIAALIEKLHQLSRSQSVAVRSPTVDIRECVAAALVRALTNSDLPMPVFLACAEALKHTMNADAGSEAWRVVTDAKDKILEKLGRPAPSDLRVIAALKMLESAAVQHQRCKLEEIAAAVPERVRSERLGELIKAQTGFWCTDWRTAFLLRPSVLPLLNADVDIKQIVRPLLRSRT